MRHYFSSIFTSFLSPSPKLKGLVLCLAVFLGSTFVLNGLIFAFDFNDRPVAIAEGVLPAGHVIGAVWSVLFAALAFAYWLVANRPQGLWPATFTPQGHILAFTGFCLSYPVLTLGFRVGSLVVAGNLICIVWSGALAGYFAPHMRRVALLVFMPAVWVMYVTYLIAMTAMMNEG